MILYLVTGSYPPDVCGVGDYSYKLMLSLQEQNITPQVLKQNDLGFSLGFFKKLRSINTVCHIQYPAQGYGKKVSAQIISILAKNCIVTLHEFSQAKLLRKLAEIPFFLFSKKLIFTNQYELDAVAKFFPFIRKKSEIIPISSNIDVTASLSQDRKGLLFFGLLRPNKGLEDFIECVRECIRIGYHGPFKVYGAILSGQETYAAQIQSSSTDLPIEWNINKNEKEVSQGLATSLYAYLSFPDGVSERRGSFLAAILHNTIVLSNSGEMTSSSLKNSFIDVIDYKDAAQKILQLENGLSLNRDPMKIQEIKKTHSWNQIAKLHSDLYREIIG